MFNSSSKMESADESSSSQTPMASLIESIDHRLDGDSAVNRTIKTEAANYDEMVANIFALRSTEPNTDPQSSYDVDMEGIDMGDQSYNNGCYPYDGLDLLQSSTQSNIPGCTFNIDRFLRTGELSADGDAAIGSDWSKWNMMKTNRKLNAMNEATGECVDVYTDEGFLQNDSIEQVLSMIYSDGKRGLLRYSYRIWAINRLGINPLKEVSCRLNWAEVVPACLQDDLAEDARVKNALRKYISNYIYNCRQTIVVRENREELNRIKSLALPKDRLRKAIAQLVNKTSDQYGWTLYRPIPSYIMRNISGVRNKSFKLQQQLQQAIKTDENDANDEHSGDQSNDDNNSNVDQLSDTSKDISFSNRATAVKHVFLRSAECGILRESYRDEVLSQLNIKNWLTVDMNEIDYERFVPEPLKGEAALSRRIQSRLNAYITSTVRQARLRFIADKYAETILKIREKYTRENVPEQMIIDLLANIFKENGWAVSQAPSVVGLKGWIFDRSVDFFKNKAQHKAQPTNNGELEWEDDETNDDSCEIDPQTPDENSQSSSQGSKSFKAAMHEVFDSRRRIKGSFRKKVYEALNIRPTMKGDPSQLDFTKVIPAPIHRQVATMRRIVRHLMSDASGRILTQRRTLIMQKRAAQMAFIRRHYATSKEVPREMIKQIIDDVYAEEEWGEHKPNAEQFLIHLYAYSMAYVDRMGEGNLEEMEESEEASCSKSYSGSLNEDDDVDDDVVNDNENDTNDDVVNDMPSASRGDAIKPRRSERMVVRKRSLEDNDLPLLEIKKRAETPSPTKRSEEPLVNADIDTASVDQCIENASDTLDLVIKGLFERDINGPLSSVFRRRVVEQLGISMSFSGVLEQLDFVPLVPPIVRRNKEVFEKVRQQIITYLTGFIRRTRLTYIAEKRAPELVELLKQYPKQNSVPLNTLYALINRIAKEKGWKQYLPLASKLKYRIYERRDLIMKRAANNAQDFEMFQAALQSEQQCIPPASATAIVATGSLVTPIRTSDFTGKRDSFSSSLLSIGGKSVFAFPDGEENQATVSSTTLVSGGASTSGRRSSMASDSSSDHFMQSMKNKLKDMNPEEMSALMNRINDHVRDKLITQLASQIVANFDPNQHDSIFNEILGIVDSNKPIGTPP